MTGARSSMKEGSEERDRREALEGLDLPAHTVGAWLDDDIAFCREHGGERVYGELLAILERFRAISGERAR